MMGMMVMVVVVGDDGVMFNGDGVSGSDADNDDDSDSGVGW